MDRSSSITLLLDVKSYLKSDHFNGGVVIFDASDPNRASGLLTAGVGERSTVTMTDPARASVRTGKDPLKLP
jgi:hypothetical protein